MRNDKRTLKDLSFIGSEQAGNIMHMIDRCTTFVGRAALEKHIYRSPADYVSLCRHQEAIRYLATQAPEWPEQITNGTIVMLEKFYESADSYSSHPGGMNFLTGKLFQKLFNRSEYFFTQFSLTHLSDLLNGCSYFVSWLKDKELPELLRVLLTEMEQAMDHRLTADLKRIDKQTAFRDLARLSFHARREMKVNVQLLTEAYAMLDAWHSMAVATREHHWVFPELTPSLPVQFKAEGLFHPLLQTPVHYNTNFSEGNNFMILTGANMSGKTTMMRALGVASLLAHLGMGVPASAFRISFLHGVITNMHVEDDLLKGESFFLAEVKSIKQTAEIIASDQPQLVLMDELFKGTNVHDAYECTKAIVDGLLLHPNHILVLSTHLHEVAHFFEQHKGISFYCFQTHLSEDGNYEFSYQLKPGISDDRIGYKILVKEGIVALLHQTTANGNL